MAGPELMKKAAKSANPLVAWKEKREAKKRALAEEAARSITNDMAENEMKIIDILENVDFLHSRLPKEMLEAKRNETQKYPDIEYRNKAIIKQIRNYPLNVQIDIRKIDGKLLILAHIFSDAVKNGQPNVAKAAQQALIRGVREIRTNVPANKESLFKLYVDVNSAHLESWINLCSMAELVDTYKDQELKYQAIVDASDRAYKEDSEKLENEIRGNEKFTLSFGKITEDSSMGARASWDDTDREVHKLMVDQRMTRVNLDLKKMRLAEAQDAHLAALGKMEILHTKVAGIPVVTDPDLMNKYQDEIDGLFEEFAKADAEFDETLKSFEDIDGRIKQLDSLPGAVHAREVASDEARRTLEEIQKKQQEKTGQNKVDASAMKARLGILSDEEMARIREENEAKQASEVEAMMQEEEGAVLYN